MWAMSWGMVTHRFDGIAALAHAKASSMGSGAAR